MTAATGSAPNGAPRRIHLYRTQNQLGDLLLNVPAIRAIRERFPEAHVTLILGRQNAAAVLGQAWADEVRVVDTKNFVGMLRHAIRPAPRPDLSVYFTTVSYSRSGATLVRASGGRERIGFDPAHYGERDRAGLTRAVAYPGGLLHQSEVSLALAAAVGAGTVPPPPYYVPDPSLVEISPAGVVYLHPGAGKIKNRWPVDRFADVAREIRARGRDVRWIAGPQDAGTVEAATEALGETLPVVRNEPIASLAARFARAALYIGNDTGPLHLAGAVGCPTLGIYGSFDPREWAPVGRCVRHVRADDQTLESISVERVLGAALPLIQEERCAMA